MDVAPEEKGRNKDDELHRYRDLSNLSGGTRGTYDVDDMTFSALLVCVDETSSQMLGEVLEGLNFRVETCPDFVRAGIRMAQERFDVAIFDGSSTNQVFALLRETRQSRQNEATLAIVVVPSQDQIREIFSLGVNFILYKPVSYDKALSTLRAARTVLDRDKRKKGRAAVHAHATIDYANVEREQATLVDLAEDGMSVQFGKKLPPVNKVYFQFKLPGQKSNIRLSGQVMWQDWKGRAGIKFADVPKASRALLTEFLAVTLPKASPRAAFPEVTVEMEESLQVSAVAVAELTHVKETVEKTRGVTKAAESAVAVQAADADNRRTQTRYACRLGAEVYRPGISVPHRCCLTDLSSGGCYLEVALPFTQGSPVEIVVRTYEMKLQLRGTVLTSHPGYGMGVGFELDNEEERANLKKLTDFVAATQSNE